MAAFSAPPHASKLDVGLRMLQSMGLRVTQGRTLSPRQESPPCADYLAAPASVRAAELQGLLLSPECDAVMAARGGFGSAHLLPLLDWPALAGCSKPLMGYSDLTALFLGLASRGVARPVWTAMAETLPSFMGNPDSALWMERMLGPPAVRASVQIPFSPDFVPLRRGAASGPAIPATLSVFSSMLGTPWLPSLRGCVLILEDVSEPVYKLDRYLTQLLLAGVASSSAAVVFGRFADCEEAPRRMRLLSEFAEAAGVPCAAGLPFGHVQPSLTIPYAARASLDSSGFSLSPPEWDDAF